MSDRIRGNILYNVEDLSISFGEGLTAQWDGEPILIVEYGGPYPFNFAFTREIAVQMSIAIAEWFTRFPPQPEEHTNGE